MASTEAGTSFQQYKLCSLCKMNHTNGKKHIYSKRHQHILQAVLKKFSDKIHSVRKDLFNPKVNGSNFEKGAKFWCYFCKEEKEKHEMMENCTVISGGLLEHIACTDHRSNMDQFFWDNLLKKELKPKFILSLEDLQIFKKAAFLAVKKWQKAESNSRKVVAESIAMMEQKRLSESANRITSLNKEAGSSQMGISPASVAESSYARIPGLDGATGSTSMNSGKRKTVSARGEGLTCILKQDKSVTDEGNVHTGALPPWLQTDTETSQRQEIGPTMEDYQKNLEREKKAKLPANRVGAKFDHTASRSHDWLPSFGRVWSKGRRLQSKQYFERNLKKGSKSNINSSRSSTNQQHGVSDYQKDSANNSDWSESHATANQNHLQHSKDWNLDLPTSSMSTNNLSTNLVIPYKRKKNQQNVTAPVIGGMFPSYTVSESSHHVIPYKRLRNNDSTVTLLQTPLLASTEHK